MTKYCKVKVIKNIVGGDNACTNTHPFDLIARGLGNTGLFYEDKDWPDGENESFRVDTVPEDFQFDGDNYSELTEEEARGLLVIHADYKKYEAIHWNGKTEGEGEAIKQCLLRLI